MPSKWWIFHGYVSFRDGYLIFIEDINGPPLRKISNPHTRKTTRNACHEFLRKPVT